MNCVLTPGVAVRLISSAEGGSGGLNQKAGEPEYQSVGTQGSRPIRYAFAASGIRLPGGLS